MNRDIEHNRPDTPELLLADRTLSTAQKIVLLESWEEDLQAGLRASDESMTSLDPGLTGSLLQRVMACLETLRSVAKAGVEPTA